MEILSFLTILTKGKKTFATLCGCLSPFENGASSKRRELAPKGENDSFKRCSLSIACNILIILTFIHEDVRLQKFGPMLTIGILK